MFNDKIGGIKMSQKIRDNFRENNLNDLITYIEDRPQINAVGILQVLEPLMKPRKGDQLEANLDLPKVYQELRVYYNQLNEAVKNGETCHNQAGVLQTLKSIKRKYF